MELDLNRRHLIKRIQEEWGEGFRTYGWSHCYMQDAMLAAAPVLGMMPNVLYSCQHPLELQLDVLAKASKTTVLPLSVDQSSAKLDLQLANRPRQTGLGDATQSRCCGEVEWYAPDSVDT